MNEHETPGPAGEPAQGPATPGGATGNPARPWRRRALLAACGALGGAALLVALLPTMATSRFVLSRVETNLSERIGRPVVIGDVDFGWFTELRVDAVSIPSLPSEGAAGPMFAISKLHAPISVGSLLGDGPLDLGLLSVGVLESNVVRFDDGRTNVEIALAGWNASAPPDDGGDGDKQVKPSSPTPLPIRTLKAKVSRTSARFHDQQSGLVAGVEDAALDVDWKGPGDSVIASLVGGGRVNDARVPVDLVVALAELTDAAAIPTPEATDVTYRLLLDGAEPPIIEGGLQQKVGDRIMAMRFNADLARVATIIQAAAPGAGMGRADGRARGELRIAGIGGDRTTVALNVATSAVAVPGAEGKPVILPDLTMQGTAALRVMDEFLEQFALKASVTGLDLTASLSSLPFGGPSRDTALSMKLDASLEPFTLAAMKTAGVESTKAPATGSLSLSAATTAGLEENAPTQLDVRVAWTGGELRTLAPFAEDPAALKAGPFDLSPTSFELAGAVTFDPEARTLQSEGLAWKAPGLGDGIVTVNGALPAGAKPEGVLVANLELDLGRLRSALGPLVPATLGTLSGNSKTRLQVRSAEGRPTSLDFGAEVPSLTLAIGEPHMTIFRGEPVSFDSTVKLGGADAAVLVESAGLRSPLANVTAAGKLVEGEGAVVDAEWSANLARIFSVVNATKPVSGLRDLAGLASGRLSARYTKPQEPTVFVEGSIADGRAVLDSGDRVPLPATFVFDVTPTLDRPAGPTVRIDRAEAAWPGVGSVSAKGSIASEGTSIPTMLDGQLTLDHAGLLANLPAAMRAKAPAGLLLDGTSTTTYSVRGDAAPTNTAPGSLQVQLKSDASIPRMTVPLEGGPLTLTGQTLKASVDADLAPAEPSKARFVATWEHRAERAAGPRGLALNALQTAMHVEGASMDRVNLMPGFSFESASIDTESGRLTVPSTRAAFDLRTERGFSAIKLEPSRFSIGTILSWTGSGSLDRGTGAWSLKGDGRISDLSSASRMLEPAPGAAPPAEWWGSLGITHDISGVPNPIGELGRKVMPFRGSVELRGETLAADMHDGRTFGGGKGTLTLTADAARLAAAGDLRFATLRTAAEPAKPLADVVLEFAAATTDLDRVDVTKLRAAAGNMKASLDATASVVGLHPLLARAVEDAAAGRPASLPSGVEWLSVLSFKSAGNAVLDTAALSDPAVGLAMSGPLDVRWNAVSQPDTTLGLDLDVLSRGVSASSAGTWRVDQTSGTLGLAKSWRIGRAGFRAPDPQFKSTLMERVEFDNPPFSLRIRNMALRTRAADNGIVIEARTAYMNGGPAAFDGTINLVGGEPVLEGSLQSTKLDLRTILPPPAKNAPAPLELDAITRVSWNMGRMLETRNVLEGLEVTSAIPRIDLATIFAILRAFQPIIGSAQSVATEAALRYSVPSDATMTIRNGTFTFQVRAKPALSPVPIPIDLVDRINLSNATKTKDFSGVLARIGMARVALRAILAETITEAGRAAEPPSGRGRP